MTTQLEVHVPSSGVWKCPWLFGEVGFVFRIDPKVMWFAFQAGMEIKRFLEILVAGSPVGVAPFQGHLLHEVGSEGSRHLSYMVDLLDDRMDIIRRSCLSAETLLRAASGDHTAIGEYTMHYTSCLGQCVNQYGFLKQVLDPQRREYDVLRLGA